MYISLLLDGNHGLPDLEQNLAWKSSKPFSDKSQCEKEELYERIAEQLAAIADKLNLESPRSMKSSSQSGPEDEKTELSGIGLYISLFVTFMIRVSNTPGYPGNLIDFFIL